MQNRLQSYFIGVAWFILSLICSAANDVISKYMGVRLHSYEITFLRFVFCIITLIPFIGYYGIATLKTSSPMIHVARGTILFVCIAGWIHGLTLVPVTTATVVTFTMPIFVLILGAIFLKERVIWQRWIVVVTACIGLAVTLKPNTSDFNPETLIFIGTAIGFAILDIINKKFVIQESMISMLFYSAIITALFALPFAIKHWIAPNLYELCLLFALGASANLLLFFMLKAFEYADATAVAPYRYFELVVSATMAYIVFQEVPDSSTIWGAIIVIPSTLFILYSEKKQLTKRQDHEKA